MAEKKIDLYFVIPKKDFQYLDKKAECELNKVLDIIECGRVRDRRNLLGDNKYIVCNQDEPYSEKVWQAILDGEDKK